MTLFRVIQLTGIFFIYWSTKTKAGLHSSQFFIKILLVLVTLVLERSHTVGNPTTSG